MEKFDKFPNHPWYSSEEYNMDMKYYHFDPPSQDYDMIEVNDISYNTWVYL